MAPHLAKHRRLARVGTSLSLVALGISVLVACSSSGSSGTNSSATNSSATGGGTGSGTTTSTAACVSAAKAAVATYKTPMPLDLPSTSTNMSKLSGKTIWFITPILEPFLISVTNAFNAAGKAAGVGTHIYNAKAQPNLYNTGIEQAVAAHAAGIVLWAIPPDSVPNALANAKKAGIPVVAGATGVPNPTDGTVAGTVSVDLALEGTQMANYALMITGCKTNALVAYDPGPKALTAELAGIKATFAKACPSTCKITEQSMSLATMATQLQTQTARFLLRDKTINVAISTFDTAATYMAPAVANAKLKLISTNGLSANLTSVRTTGPQIADVSYPPGEYVGWLMFDQTARAAMGEPVTQTTLPLQLFDKSNLPASNDFNSLWPKLVGYQAKFTALWGG